MQNNTQTHKKAINQLKNLLIKFQNVNIQAEYILENLLV